MKKQLKFKTNQKKKENLLYKFFITTIVIGLVYHGFIESNYIGGDNRYDLYVFWIPIIIGIILAVKYDLLQMKWKGYFENEKSVILKYLSIPITFIAHFIFSVIMFWIPSNIIWDSLNKIEANKNAKEVYSLPIVAFHDVKSSKSRDRIYFNFNGEKEHILVKYKTIKRYLDKNPNDYKIRIEVRKGIWKYYILDSFEILE